MDDSATPTCSHGGNHGMNKIGEGSGQPHLSASAWRDRCCCRAREGQAGAREPLHNLLRRRHLRSRAVCCVANPRDSCSYRCGLRLASHPDPQRLLAARGYAEVPKADRMAIEHNRTLGDGAPWRCRLSCLCRGLWTTFSLGRAVRRTFALLDRDLDDAPGLARGCEPC